jgi:hypothetical protein
MKKRAKRYQEGGVLRDRFGNPVRSGSGEAVRTKYPERSYDEQSTADMTESSDYSGRRRKSPERSMSDMDSDSSYMPSGRTPSIGYGNDEETSSSYMSSGRMPDIGYGGGEETSDKQKVKKPKLKPKVAKKRASQSFGVDEAGMEERKKSASSFQPTPKSKFSDTGKSTRLRALLGTFGMKSGGKVSSASSRADGVAQRGKTKGRIC